MCCVAAVALVSSSLVQPAFSTDVSGTISSNTTWNTAGSPWVVVGTVTVASGATLTIDPGVEVRFSDYFELIVNGALSAVGTVNAPIIFTSSATSPAPLDWADIRFTDSSDDNTCVIKHAMITFAGTGIQISDASPQIENVWVAHCYDAGIQVNGGAPTISDCFLYENDGSFAFGSGIMCTGSGTPTITENAIFDNRKGIYLFGTPGDYPDPTISNNAIFGNNVNLNALASGDLSLVTIGAENNWWGTTNQTEISASITDNADVSTYPVVDFVPFLNSPPVLVVYDLAVTPAVFSPNADAELDNTTVTATFTLSADWTLRVLNASGIAVRTFTGSGVSISQVWAGKDDQGAAVADGVYTVEVVASDSGAQFRSERKPVTVDTTAPTVVIDVPTNGATVTGVNPVLGTVNDTNLASFTVEYGVGASPSSWVPITSSTQPVTGGQLTAWDARWLSNGTYVLRVRAEDLGGNDSSEQRQVTLDNVQITSVTASPQFFAPGNATTTISYTLDRAAKIFIRIYALNFQPPALFSVFLITEQLVASPVVNVSKPVGVNTSAWNGRDDQGSLLPFAAYSYSIEAITDTRQGLYDPVYSPGTIQFANQAAPTLYNPYKNETVEFEYSTVAPAWVNLKVVDASVPNGILRDLVTWVPQDSVTHEVLWDGRANNGSVVTIQNRCYGFGQILPDNSVVTVARSSDVTALSCRPYLFRPIYREITNIEYTIAAAAKVVIKVYDPDGTLFATIQDDTSPRAAGSYTLEWAGTNDAGLRAYKNGSYRVDVSSSGVDNDTVTRSGSVTIYK